MGIHTHLTTMNVAWIHHQIYILSSIQMMNKHRPSDKNGYTHTIIINMAWMHHQISILYQYRWWTKVCIIINNNTTIYTFFVFIYTFKSMYSRKKWEYIPHNNECGMNISSNFYPFFDADDEQKYVHSRKKWVYTHTPH